MKDAKNAEVVLGDGYCAQTEDGVGCVRLVLMSLDATEMMSEKGLRM